MGLLSIAPLNAARADSPITAVAQLPEQLDVFWIGPDGGVGSAAWNANSGWSAPFPIAPPNAARADSPITAVARFPEQLDVFWIGPDGGVGSAAWNANSGWSAPFPIAPPNAARADSPITAVSRFPSNWMCSGLDRMEAWEVPRGM